MFKRGCYRKYENTIHLSSFGIHEFPKALDGCACYFKEKGKEEERYIYLDDFAQAAFINIGDTFEQLEIYYAMNDKGKLFHKC
jgi:hypothetical protein